mmetsp:Transcript_13734/g.31760  ORF Transcript_13734/g.31760 Transcript_13734/m.31760 type:complete len:300 (-) Transcript_13734:4894-5793(-)
MHQLGVAPSLDHGSPAYSSRRHPHHAATRNRGRRGDLEVLDLEQHAHCDTVELDALAVGQAQRPVIVQHRVHVLDPDSVYGPVEDDPLAVWGGVVVGSADDGRPEAVGPLVGEQVEVAVQLTHGDGLGVEREHVRDLDVIVARPLVAEQRAGVGQRVRHRTLAASSGADSHHTEADREGLVQLHNLEDELVGENQPGGGRDAVNNGSLQVARLVERHLHAGEQVADNRLEENHVVLQKLGHVGVSHGADKHNVLGQVRVGSLERTRHDQHRLDGAHAEVVVVLLRELLGAELIQLDHLP